MSVDDLARYLEGKGIPAEIREFDKPVETVRQASEITGVHHRRIIKSLVVMDGEGRAHICIIPGDQRLSLAKVKGALGVERVKLASDEEILRETGYDVGAVPPVGHLKRLRVLMDPSVQRWETVVGGGGSTTALIEISPQEILRATQAEVVDIRL